MGRDSKTVQLSRQAEFAKIMADGLGYHYEWEWYRNHYPNSEKTFQADKTIIYEQWKVDNAKDLDAVKMDILNKLLAARKRAIDLMDVKAEIQAIKLESEIMGILNRKGEVQVNVQNNILNLDSKSLEELFVAR